MTATGQRDEVIRIAKEDPLQALTLARDIQVPWFKAQALSSVIRYIHQSPIAIAQEAAQCASECKDTYQQSAVRAWEIDALNYRGFTIEAQAALSECLSSAPAIHPPSSRAEALILLLHAALNLTKNDAQRVADTLNKTCRAQDHWRCKRALRDCACLLNKEMPIRSFL